TKPEPWQSRQLTACFRCTESTPLIVGFATALALSHQEKDEEVKRLIPLREKLIKGILERIPKSILNGHATDRLPNNVNITLLDVEGEAMLFYLDEEGIAASTGSACTSGTLDPSHVILATGMPYEAAHGSLRFTLGRSTTEADLDHVLQVLPGIIANLRDISPANIDMNDFLKKVNLIRQSA
ncbi:MAG: aminotransferase class V-fold PLP-dependent enzyme, partial [Parcubacteria group bacterium]|nr:aminotransferase class V-fold PLP-dependent enzyme [Parcubacteria group bacterium]